MKEEKIVTGVVTQVLEDKIVVNVDNTFYDCPLKMISDYPVDPFKFFTVGTRYRFLLINKSVISYKDLRPKLLKNRRKPIPTVSGSKNLEKHLLEIIGEKKNM
ncbi:hypothetical protein [Malacoplasma muris]|uniref:hypothetical protein n=1 Tax=Malacoplasma muris TaxID=2119 RepID=UPI00398E5112